MSDAAVVVGDDPLAGCDFSILGPMLEQKQLMVSMVLQKIETAASVAKKYSYNRKHLHRLVRRHLQGAPIRLKSGRPRVLDSISHDTITATTRNQLCSSEVALNQSIRDEFKASHIRRHQEVVIFIRTRSKSPDGAKNAMPADFIPEYSLIRVIFPQNNLMSIGRSEST